MCLIFTVNGFLFQSLIKKQMIAIDSDPHLDPLEKAQRKQSIYLAFSINNSGSVASAVSPLSTPFYPACDTVESVVGEGIVFCEERGLVTRMCLVHLEELLDVILL
jgi:hypothetical protein